MKSPVTDRHIGTTKTYDHESYGEIRQKAGFADDGWRGHTKRRRKEEPTSWQDFEIGQLLVCERHEKNGFTGQLLVRVIDAYDDGSRIFTRGTVFGAVEAVEQQKHAGMVGHIWRLSTEYGKKNMYWRDDFIFPTTDDPANFQAFRGAIGNQAV